jgi:hypothetical protein
VSKPLFGILFENISAKDADALKHFDNGCKLLREARGYARNMITGADHESPAHRTGPPRHNERKEQMKFRDRLVPKSAQEKTTFDVRNVPFS